MDLKELLSKYDKPAGSHEGLKPLILKNDKDTVKVKLLFSTEGDFINFVKPVHTMKIGEYANDILCTGDGCRLCKAGDKPKLKTVVPMYDVDKQEVLVWKRGVNTIKDIQAIFDDPDEDYSDFTNLTFRITRQGAKGDTATKYNIKTIKNVKIDNLEELTANRPNIVGRDFKGILELTDAQKQELLETGKIDWKASVPQADVTIDDGDIPF